MKDLHCFQRRWRGRRSNPVSGEKRAGSRVKCEISRRCIPTLRGSHARPRRDATQLSECANTAGGPLVVNRRNRERDGACAPAVECALLRTFTSRSPGPRRARARAPTLASSRGWALLLRSPSAAAGSLQSPLCCFAAAPFRYAASYARHTTRLISFGDVMSHHVERVMHVWTHTCDAVRCARARERNVRSARCV